MSEVAFSGLHLFVKTEVPARGKIAIPKILRKWQSLPDNERSKWCTKSISPSLFPIGGNCCVILYEYNEERV